MGPYPDHARPAGHLFTAPKLRWRRQGRFLDVNFSRIYRAAADGRRCLSVYDFPLDLDVCTAGVRLDLPNRPRGALSRRRHGLEPRCDTRVLVALVLPQPFRAAPLTLLARWFDHSTPIDESGLPHHSALNHLLERERVRQSFRTLPPGSDRRRSYRQDRTGCTRPRRRSSPRRKKHRPGGCRPMQSLRSGLVQRTKQSRSTIQRRFFSCRSPLRPCRRSPMHKTRL